MDGFLEGYVSRAPKMVMASTCAMCDRVAYDRCELCGNEVCRTHGRTAGDRFVCVECIDRAR
jgi:hypothetical protein